MTHFLTEGMPGLIAPALAAGLVVASTHVPLGREVLKRGIIFLDLAVAQIAGLGAVAAATLLGWEGIGGQIVAFLCALLAAFAFSWLEKKGQTIQEAFIGCAFVLAASLVILLFAGDPHGGEDVSNLLAGQILWVQWKAVGLTALVYAPVLAVLLFRPALAQRYFYLLFAASITLSVQLVGIYLVFASLILPALAAAHMAGHRGIVRGWVVAFAAIFGGLVFSALTDLPSGPALVLAYAVAAGAAALMRSRRSAGALMALLLCSTGLSACAATKSARQDVFVACLNEAEMVDGKSYAFHTSSRGHSPPHIPSEVYQAKDFCREMRDGAENKNQRHALAVQCRDNLNAYAVQYPSDGQHVRAMQGICREMTTDHAHE
jgi:zinc/manganese transport system permease protein